MANYSQIVETLQSRIDSGKITFEDAQEVLKRYENEYLTEKPDLENENEEVAEESKAEEPAPAPAAEPVQEAAQESENATEDTKEVVQESSEDDEVKGMTNEEITEALNEIESYLDKLCLEAPEDLGKTDPHDTKVSEKEIKAEEKPVGDKERTKADDVAGNNAASKAKLSDASKYIQNIKSDINTVTGEKTPRKLLENTEENRISADDVIALAEKVHEAYKAGRITAEQANECLDELDPDNYE